MSTGTQQKICVETEDFGAERKEGGNLGGNSKREEVKHATSLKRKRKNTPNGDGVVEPTLPSPY